MEENIEKPCVIISACLFGKCVRYDGRVKNTLSDLDELKKKYRLVPVCPEMLGGLGMPRPQSEIKNGRVINILGADVTDAFRKGAEKTYEIFVKNNAEFAILKESSPSCGRNTVYDGSFSGIKTKGRGITADYLLNKGIKVISEKELYKLNERQ